MFLWVLSGSIEMLRKNILKNLKTLKKEKIMIFITKLKMKIDVIPRSRFKNSRNRYRFNFQICGRLDINSIDCAADNNIFPLNYVQATFSIYVQFYISTEYLYHNQKHRPLCCSQPCK